MLNFIYANRSVGVAVATIHKIEPASKTINKKTTPPRCVLYVCMAIEYTLIQRLDSTATHPIYFIRKYSCSTFLCNSRMSLNEYGIFGNPFHYDVYYDTLNLMEKMA